MPQVKNSTDKLVVNRKGENLSGNLANNNKVAIKGAAIVFCDAVAVTTDDDGDFNDALDEVKNAEYGVEIKNNAGNVLLAGRFTQNDTDIPPTAAGDVLAISMAGKKVSGRFTDKRGNAIRRVQVVIGNLTGNPFSATTNGKGEFDTSAEAKEGKQFFVKVTINPGAKNERLLLGAFISD